MLKRILTLVLCIVGAVCMFAATATAQTATPEQKVGSAEQFVDQALTYAKQGDLGAAKKSFQRFHDQWFNIEDGVRERSATAYSDIESNMGQVQYAFLKNDASAVVNALEGLKTANAKFAAGKDAKQAFQKQNITLDGFILLLQQTKTDANAGRQSAAVADIAKVRQSWLSVEGSVVAQSQTVYDAVERDMVTVNAMLSSTPPDVRGATSLIDRMVSELSPLATKSGYTLWDAAMIPIREGLEALLVVAALLTFVRKSGSNQGKAWVWGGVSTGVGLSLILAVLVKLIFSSGAFGQNNFLIAGWTGVIAAVMLVYMSYWLHGRSQISDWQKYLRTRTEAALTTGRLVSLGLLSFLAVFREGTETVLFIIGMVNQIQLHALILGLALGLIVLGVIAYLMMGLGKRLPMKPFFMISSLIVFYLSIKFTGLGIHSLQLAGTIPSTTLTIPSVSFLALYPSVQSAVPQLVLVLLALGVVLWRGRGGHKHTAAESR